jgi:hypothetical protein
MDTVVRPVGDKEIAGAVQCQGLWVRQPKTVYGWVGGSRSTRAKNDLRSYSFALQVARGKDIPGSIQKVHCAIARARKPGVNCTLIVQV